MFVLHHLECAQPADSKQSGSAILKPPYPAIVEYRESPPTDGSRGQFIWFAYASSKFFQSVSNGLILPIWDPEDPKTRRQPFEMQTVFELSRLPPGLPSVVTFLNDAFYRSYNPATRSLDVIPLQPPFDKGFTKAVYRVTAVTNTPLNEIPASFVFTVYATPIGNGAELFERIVLRGITTQCRDGAPEGQSRPLFEGLASVADFRFHGDAHAPNNPNMIYRFARYSITNGNWVMPENARR